MKTGILLLNFGEPERTDLDEVIPFLEAIFEANYRLEHDDAEGGRRRAAELAARRAPALLEDYRRMGDSPLADQTRTQARGLAVELRRRGFEAVTSVGMQFASPSMTCAVAELRSEGVERVVGLPVYPLCGRSTTLYALDEMRRVILSAEWDVEITDISGWHRHPEYTKLRARAVRRFCEEHGLDLLDPHTVVVFCAHGTPLRYLREGSRYDRYVDDHCDAVAAELDVADYMRGFQNHENRPGVDWTQPEIGSALRHAKADRVLVVPVSFMQEQSETLVELDLDLRASVEERGLDYYRVPIPYDDPAFVSVLADVVEDGVRAPGACRCRSGAFCLNNRY